mmetsp:Transcript_5165/g.15680  ORF Transcript_5165/g.15680 Transcript_5165/m.15680 type:complete len:259 (+) Transcript_5165:90-866(+)
MNGEPRLMNGGSQIESSESVVCHQFAPPPPTPLEARLLAAESAREAAEAAREAAEARALRAEADAHRLRQQLTLFGEKMISLAKSSVVVHQSPMPSSIAAAPTSPESAHSVVSRVAETSRSEAGLLEAAAVDRVERASSIASSEQPSAKRSRRVWMFNPKWRIGRDWLEYDMTNETMGCSVCRIAGESGKWARTGITRMRLEAITSHANDQKHQRHLADAEAAKRAETQQRAAMHAPTPSAQHGGIPPDLAPRSQPRT